MSTDLSRDVLESNAEDKSTTTPKKTANRSSNESTKDTPVIGVQTTLQEEKITSLLGVAVVDTTEDEDGENTTETANDNLEAAPPVELVDEANDEDGDGGGGDKLLLALEWGGATYAWNDGRIIGLFVVFGVAFIAFAAVQVLMPKTATVPVRIITQRTMLAGAFFMVFLAGSMMLAVYYLPLWFQAVQGANPVNSGIYTIPLVLSIVVSSIISGGMTQKIGYYVPSMILCPCIMSVGLGLMSTFQPGISSGHWIGYQFLTGFGLGFGMQTVGLAVQAVLPKEDVSTGVSISFFAQQLGAAIFVSVGQSILSNLLVSELSGIPGLPAQAIVNSGATNLRAVVPGQYLDLVIRAYNYACTRIFLAALGLSLATLVCALCMQWRNIKKGKRGPRAGRIGPEAE